MDYMSDQTRNALTKSLDVLKKDRIRIKELDFRNKYLFLFLTPTKEETNVAYWIDQVLGGNHFREVDVVGDNDEICFTIPAPLVRDVKFTKDSRTLSLSGSKQNYDNTLRMNPLKARIDLKKALKDNLDVEIEDTGYAEGLRGMLEYYGLEPESNLKGGSDDKGTSYFSDEEGEI